MTFAASGPLYFANVIVGLATFNYETYVPQPWHTTMVMISFIAVLVFCNCYFRRLLYTLEMIGVIVHIAFFVISIIILAVMADWGSSKFVFNTLTHDQSGWTNPAACWGLGLLTVAYPLLGESDLGIYGYNIF